MCANRNVKQLRAVLLVAMAVGLGMQAFAYGFPAGTGEPNDPYQISTAEDLISIGSDPNLLNRHYVLTDDVNLADRVFSAAVIAPDTDLKEGFDGTFFTGKFDGQGHKILNLTIEAGEIGSDFLGLFGGVGEDGQVLCLGIENANLSGGRYCQSLGSTAGANSGLIHQCYATGSVSGRDWSVDIAGLVGSNTGTISQSYATTNISGGQYSNLAGLVGSSAGVISQCYARANILESGIFSSVAGLVGSNTGAIHHSYFLNPVESGELDNGLGIPLTDEQLRQPENLLGWDYYDKDTDGHVDAWVMSDQGDPVLAWQTDVTDLIWLPQVKRTSLEATQITLADTGLVLGDIYYDFDSTVPADKVICINGGHPAPVGTTVNVLVSLGPCDWQQNPGDGTNTNPYELGSAGQLACLSENDELLNKHFVLSSDIDMSGRIYLDAVIQGEAESFRGSFDGRGYKIIGLTIISASRYVGLFGLSYGEIRDLVLEDARVLGKSSPESDCGAGLLAGYINGTVKDCMVDGSAMGISNVGGLVGRSQSSGSIERCYATGDVRGKDKVGGLVGYLWGSTIYQSSSEGSVFGHELLGGLVGHVRQDWITDNAAIDQCYATGDVYGQNQLGGLVGYSWRTRYSDCFASGNISGVDELGGLVGYADCLPIYRCFAVGDVAGRNRLGGLLGSGDGYGHGGPIQECFATGEISGNDDLGGLIGYAYYAHIMQCYASGNVSGNTGIGGLVGRRHGSVGSLSECYATGVVAGIEAIGGLVGLRDGNAPSTTESFWDTETSSLLESVDGTGLTTIEMQTLTTFIDAGWDSAETWMICEGQDYPRLVWEGVQCGQW